MITEAVLASLREYVASAFEAGMPVFPHFTLHGREHLEELDRLALLLGGAIPALAERQERLNLLRFALLLHDFAMVDVPDDAREIYHRRLHTGEIPFSDLVREVHQDEIDHCFSNPERLAFLTGLLPQGTHQLLEDAFIIARHHRLHPLEGAPIHLQDLCALMRIVDELDIGPRRAPLPAYQALRPRMKPVARLHWLKHICTRPIKEYETFGIEERNRRRVFKLSVAVLATRTTWRLIQQEVIGKLESCLADEGINSILQATFGVRLEIIPEGEGLSGAASFLAPSVRVDLDSLPDEVWRRPKHVTVPEGTPPHTAARQPEAPVLRADLVAAPSLREFQVVTVPPERLADLLCSSGRLTLIGNTYVPQDEEAIAGVRAAPSRIYLGPANSGKTRAASEWVQRLALG